MSAAGTPRASTSRHACAGRAAGGGRARCRPTVATTTTRASADRDRGRQRRARRRRRPRAATSPAATGRRRHRGTGTDEIAVATASSARVALELGLGPQLQAVPQHRGRDRDDVVGRHEVAAREPRRGLRRGEQVHRAARARAERDARELARPAHERDDVADDRVAHGRRVDDARAARRARPAT